MYNITNLTNATDLYQVTKAVNETSNGYFGIFLLFSLYLIVFIMFKRYDEDTRSVFLTTSAIMSVVAILMWAMGFISGSVVSIPIVMLIAGIFLFMSMK